jgi:phasin family protein
MSKNGFTPDWQKLFQQFSTTSAGNFDLSKWVQNCKQGIDTLAQVNQMTVDCGQALADCQREAVQRSLQQFGRAIESIADNASPEQKAKRSASIIQEALQTSTLTAKEAAQILTRSNREIFELLRARMQESVSEMQDSLGETARRASGKR